MSGLGKGISSSSIGVLLKNAGLHVTSIKIDPYLNIDAGTMSPYEHGEVYVLNDGGEADLDLGNYERFLGVELSKDHNLTTGKAYSNVLERERRGEYLGKTVQLVPHVTDCIQDWIHTASHTLIRDSLPAYLTRDPAACHPNDSKTPDVCMIELGGTVGDIESMVFLEAIRQLAYKVGSDNLCHVHVSLVPVVGAVGEPKSKPTQHSVRELRAAGLSPDIILCRSTQPVGRDVVSKISQFCMVPPSHVLSVHDVSNIYKVPLMLHQQGVLSLVLNKLRIHSMPPEQIGQWEMFAQRTDNPSKLVKIALVGKYTGLSDAYLSISKAFSHAGMQLDVGVELVYIDAEQLAPTQQHQLPVKHTSHQQAEQAFSKEQMEAQEAARNALSGCTGILVAGGFGHRGVSGKLEAVRYARTHKVPFVGICLGFQMAVIEYARNVLGMGQADSQEFNPNCVSPVIALLPSVSTDKMGGTMRLGGSLTILNKDSLAHSIYGTERIHERHRHRYEVNPQFVSSLQADPTVSKDDRLIFSGQAEQYPVKECLELPKSVHPFYFACQYHPEYTSRPMAPNPVFTGLVRAAVTMSNDAAKESK